MNKMSAAIFGFILAGAVSQFVATYTMHANRRVEMHANEEAGTVSEANLHWSIMHIRDEAGAIRNLIVLTNVLLAAILGALLF